MKLSEMTYDQLVDFTSEVIEELRKKAYREGYEQGRFDERMESGFKAFGEDIERTTSKSSQQQRDEIVERAKRDVDDLKDVDGLYTVESGGSFNYACYSEFIVNKEKRTVVALLRGKTSAKVRAKGIAKCHPNDCFNVHIGKAIALRRALGLEVPDEYLNAPQPTEVRIGDIVEYKGYKVEVCGYNDNRYMDYRKGTCQLGSIVSNKGKIIDDSRDE